MTGPAVASTFLLAEGDEDIIADLEKIGIVIGPDDDPALGQTRREATAGIYLMHAQQCEQRIEQMAIARDALLAPLLDRVERIRAHYAGEIQKQTARRDEMLRYVEWLAALSTYPGKKKSIATPFGTFGFRDIASTYRLVDEAQALEWAAQKVPGFVTVTAKLPLDMAVQYLTDDEMKDCKRTLKWAEVKKCLGPNTEVPPGVEKVDGGREFYAKVEER